MTPYEEKMREAELRFPYDLEARWKFVEESEEPTEPTLADLMHEGISRYTGLPLRDDPPPPTDEEMERAHAAWQVEQLRHAWDPRD